MKAKHRQTKLININTSLNAFNTGDVILTFLDLYMIISVSIFLYFYMYLFYLYIYQLIYSSISHYLSLSPSLSVYLALSLSLSFSYSVYLSIFLFSKISGIKYNIYISCNILATKQFKLPTYGESSFIHLFTLYVR